MQYKEMEFLTQYAAYLIFQKKKSDISRLLKPMQSTVYCYTRIGNALADRRERSLEHIRSNSRESSASIHICIYNIHFICPLSLIFVKAFQSVHHIPFVLCYNVLCDFVSLVFSLIRVHNALWEDITQGKR